MTHNEIIAALVIAGCFALVFVLLAAFVAIWIYNYTTLPGRRFQVKYWRDTDFL